MRRFNVAKKSENSRVERADTSVYTVKESTELLPFLLEMMTKSSRNSVKSVLTRGQVAVDGKMVKQHNHLLQVGQTVTILKNQAALNENKLIGVSICMKMRTS